MTAPRLLAAPALAACAFAACSTPQVYDKPLTPVTVSRVEAFTTGTAVRYSATAKPAIEVAVAFKVGGYVDHLLSVRDDRGRPRSVQEGDRVVKGSALARVRPSDYQQRVAEARSGLAEATAMHESARLDFERASRLYERKSLTKPELDGARARVDAAAAKVEGVRAALNQAQILLDDVVLRSPIDGIVLKRSIEQGTLVGPGQPAFVLADTSSVKVSFGVPDVVVKSLKIGRPQRVRFDALDDQEFEGRITSIAPAPDPVSRVYGIEVSIPNPKGLIEVGFIAQLQLADAPGESVASVPLEAIVKPPSGPAEYAVYVLENQDDRQVARLRAVKLGEALGHVVVVTEGLSLGERVIVRGATLVVDGETVRVIPS
ncbi:MAG TPA: efflux RND transporter periplasmic adaptor subunit [Vicinamibacterales bacterium]|nr:efflux RND transporter periplasmic adaptor subunit [Vicinamibacterales bacterium]